MKKVEIWLRDGSSEWSTRASLVGVQQCMAALAADPASAEEFFCSLQSFHPRFRFERQREEGTLGPVRGKGGFSSKRIVIIDLLGRAVFYEGRSIAIGYEGKVRIEKRIQGDCKSSLVRTFVRYCIADDWQIRDSLSDWKDIIARRRLARSARPMVDFREIMYGEPLFEYIVDELDLTFIQSMDPDDFSEVHDSLVALHEQWLWLPREEWGGDCIRDKLIEKIDFLRKDMDNRCQYWSKLGDPPVPLAESSVAYRYSGFGTNEFILYFDYVRHLLTQSWKWIALEEPDLNLDNKSELLERLREEAERWLHEPLEEFHGRSPVDMIDLERRRMPGVLTDSELAMDCDCPICQSMAGLPMITFWQLDGSHLEENQAFQMEEEWDVEIDRFNDAFRDRVQEALSQKASMRKEEMASPSSLYERDAPTTDEVSESMPLIVECFGLGCLVGQLISQLKRPMEQRPLIDVLVERWTDLRSIRAESLDGSTTGESANQIHESILKFHWALDAVLDANPDLEEQVVRIHQSLDRIDERRYALMGG